MSWYLLPKAHPSVGISPFFLLTKNVGRGRWGGFLRSKISWVRPNGLFLLFFHIYYIYIYISHWNIYNIQYHLIAIILDVSQLFSENETALDLNKCHKQIKLSVSLNMCARISIISTIGSTRERKLAYNIKKW